MDEKKQARAYKLRLLRNYFVAAGKKVMAGDIVDLEDQAEANRLLKAGIAEKLDARSFG